MHCTSSHTVDKYQQPLYVYTILVDALQIYYLPLYNIHRTSSQTADIPFIPVNITCSNSHTAHIPPTTECIHYTSRRTTDITLTIARMAYSSSHNADIPPISVYHTLY